MKPIKIIMLSAVILLNALIIVVPVDAANELNIALNKEAYASSQYAAFCNPSNVNDGIVDTIWSQGSEKLTGPLSGHEYIAVDTEAPYIIKNINVRSRRDMDQTHSRAGWIVQLSNYRDFRTSVDVGKKPDAGVFGSDLELTLDLPEAFRYVRVVSNSYFVIAELEVYGTKLDPNAKPEYADINDNIYKGAIETMQFLKIMDGVSKSEFGMHKLITRAEACQIILNLEKINLSPTNTQIFKDVPPDHWASGYVEMCLFMDVINKAEYFRPDDYITIFEFLKMVEVALGYSEKIENTGGYAAGVTTLAQQLRLLDGLKYTDHNDPLDKCNAALLMFNALKTPTMKSNGIVGDGSIRYTQDETLLESIFKMELHKGVVTANNVTNYLRPNENTDKYIKINDKVYRDNTGELKYLLGMNIYYIIQKTEPDEIICAWADDKKNHAFTVKRKDVTSAHDKVISYFYENSSRLDKYTLSDTVDVLKNGAAFPGWREDDLKASNGYLELLDNNGDGLIDIIFIHNPEIIVSDYIIVQDDSITIGGINDVRLSYHTPPNIKVVRNGKKADISDIKKLDLVFLYLSDDKLSMTVNAVSNTIHGRVDEISSEYVVIDGKSIEISDFCQDERLNMTALVLGQEYTCILDENDNLYWVMDNLWTDTGEQVGFVYKAICESGLSGAKVKIFTQRNTFETFPLSSSVLIDGEKLSNEKLKGKFDADNSYLTGKLILFKVDKEKEIISIDTDHYNAGLESEDKLKKTTPDLTNGAYYFHNLNGIYSQNRLVKPLKTSTITFKIPVVNNVVSNNSDMDKFFSVVSANSAFPQMFDINDKCDFFGEDDYGYPTFVVRYIKYSSSIGGATAITDQNAKGIIVDSVNSAVNDQEEMCYVIKGFDIATGGEIKNFVSTDITKFYDSYLIQQEHPEWLNNFNKKFLNLSAKNADGTEADFSSYMHELSKLSRGDIIIVEHMGNNISAIERVFDFNTSPLQEFTTADGSFYSLSGDNAAYAPAAFKLSYGVAQTIKEGILVLGSNITGGEYLTDIIPYIGISNMFVSDSKKVYKAKASMLPALYNSNSRIVVYSTNGVNKALFIYAY